MRVISRRALRQFWEIHSDAEPALRAWFREAQHARWSGPGDIKARYASASFLPRDRVVFNIKGNTYRLVVTIKYTAGIVLIRYVGTHRDYDRIDASEV